MRRYFGRAQAISSALNNPFGVVSAGACQGTRLSHVAKGCLSAVCEAIVTTDSRSGLGATAPIGVQSRAQRDGIIDVVILSSELVGPTVEHDYAITLGGSVDSHVAKIFQLPLSA